MQSRFQSVKCQVNRELSLGRKDLSCGFGVASRCYIPGYVIPSYVVVRTSIRRFFIANDEL